MAEPKHDKWSLLTEIQKNISSTGDFSMRQELKQLFEQVLHYHPPTK